ncbi:magnesium/cobalt transporter CorA [Haloplanus sp. GCM10025708]|uniref:magnesium/cobalt transporter CorA n=1 Tax=Haloferacaceae TaxID=1644056 RepID=UPI003605BE79
MIRVQIYGDGAVEPHEVTSRAELDEARTATGTTWVRVTDADADELDLVSDVFDLHPLEIEDVQSDVRPKAEQFESHTFVLVRTAVLRRGETTFEEEIRDEPIGLFVGDGWFVSLTTSEVPAVEAIWRSVLREDPRLLGRGSDFSAYRVVDRVVDEYFDILDEIEDDIEAVEDAIVDEPDAETLEVLTSIRRELLSVRRILWPMRDAVGVLSRGGSEQVDESTERYYRDVYDHLVQLVELVETYRDLAIGARDIYLNALSQSTNEVMKRLTVVATIILPLTFVVGVYGMNFGDSPYNMPELGWTYGYPAVVVGMFLVALVMLAYFREEEWL